MAKLHWKNYWSQLHFWRCKVGVIEYFVSHIPIITNIQNQEHILAKVKWYDDHPRKAWFGNSIIVSSTLHTNESEATFMPISRIMSRCARIEQMLKFDYGTDKVNVWMPLIQRIDEWYKIFRHNYGMLFCNVNHTEWFNIYS